MSHKKNTSHENGGTVAAEAAPPAHPCFVVGIGVSAGGQGALEQFFAAMPSDCGISFVVIMHIPPDGPSFLAEMLERYTPMAVVTAEEEMELAPNRIHVIPAGRDLTLSGGRLRLEEPAGARGVRHPIDRFFSSLAAELKARAIAVVLSGYGLDGTVGAKEVKAAGGTVIVQEPESAITPAMPRSVVASGVADYVLPAEGMAAKIAEIARGTCSLPSRACKVTTLDEELATVFSLVKFATGHDFSSYKVNTVMRRIERRMAVNETAGLNKYIAFLRENEQEAHALAQDILIGVTSFFRDPEAFEMLRTTVIPQLFADRDPDDPVRIWHACCATGEEVYSMAFLIREYLDEKRLGAKVQLFATDIDEAAIGQARVGIYDDGIEAEVGEKRLKRFFTRTDGRWQVVKSVREMIVFAHHSVIKNPPFSRLDLLVCRNFLIYLTPDMQNRLIALFHQVLKPTGHLFLGASEAVGRQSDLFAPLDKKWKIFKRLAGERRSNALFPFSTPHRFLGGRFSRQTDSGGQSPGAAVEKVLLERYAPPCVVVNGKYEVVHVSTRANRFLEVPVGEPTRDILKMAREELRPAVRAAIYKVFAEQKPVAFRGVKVVIGNEETAVNVLVEPLSAPSSEKLAMVVFEPAPVPTVPEAAGGEAGRSGDEPSRDALIRQLEEQLRVTHEQLRATSEQLESSHEGFLSANEELLSMNEEFQSANEELQSTNEELETSKEELQALNEELVTVNAELQGKVEELNQATSDMENLLASSEIATLFLDRELNIKGFTPATTRIFNLLPSDIGRPFCHLAGNIDWPTLTHDAESVLAGEPFMEREVATLDEGRCYLKRVFPYRTAEGRIDGIIIIFFDITEHKRAETEIRAGEERFHSLFTNMAEGVACHELVFDSAGNDANYRIVEVNPAYERILDLNREEIIGKLATDIYGVANPPYLAEFAAVVNSGAPLRMGTYFAPMTRHFDISIVPWGKQGFATIFTDITERKRAEETLRRYELLAGNSRDIILFMRCDDGRIMEANDAAVSAYGYDHEELMAMTVRDLRATDTLDVTAEQMTEADAHGILFETIHCRRDGSLFPVEVSSRGATIGGTRILISVIRDITERKRAEDALRESEERVRRKLDSILTPEGDIGDLDLADIIDAQSMQSLMDNFYRLTRMPMAMIDLKGKVLVGVGWQDICTKFHRIHPETCKNCIESDILLSAGVPSGEFKVYKCKNNMWDVATPIMVGDRHFGNFFMGQFFFDDEPLDYEFFRSQARQYGFDEQQYIACLESVSRMSRESLAAGMAYFMELAGMVSQMSYSNIKLARSLAERDTLMGSLQGSSERINLLAETAGRLLASDSPQKIVDELCRKVMAFLDCHLFLNFLADEDAGRLHLNACGGISDEEEKKIEWLDYGAAVCGCVARDACRIVAEDIQNTPDPRTGLVRSHGIQAYACHPLMAHGRLLGTLSFGTRSRARFEEDELALMQAVAAQVAIAMERNRTEEALRRTHEGLETKVAERTEELASAVNVLQEEVAERERAEESLRRMNRLYTVLSGTRQAIVHATDRDTLFCDFCRIAVGDGGFRLAWVGLVEEESGEVKTVAASGATGYLDEISISVREDTHGRGPTGISVREGSYYICNDFQNDPCTNPWHERGRAHGIGASASIALKQHGRVIGALTLYADTKDFFDPQQVELLQQMGTDVSFALENLEREAMLLKSERKFRTLFEESKDGIFIMTSDGGLVDINPAALELYGYSRTEVFSLDVAKGIFHDQAARERFRQTLFAQGFVRDYELQMKRKNGEVLHVLATASVVRDEQGKIAGYRGIIHDVTERKLLEQQLHHAQKMESIGLLAGGVAHDFNNLLTAISGYSQIIQEQYASKHEMLAMCIEQVMGATNRAVELTRNLLAFGRKQIINPQPLKVNDLVSGVEKLLGRIIGEDIELGTQLTEKDMIVMADRGQIDQVLINLVNNARDAMPQGGRLLIRTGEIELDRREAQQHILDQEGRYAVISVADSGHGMDRETLARIFEPFFTTKEIGKGTGLGLSIIYGIVKQHNGAITVESTPGAGSTFTVYLPLAEVPSVEAQLEEAPAPAGGIETLLLVEDDPMVRRYMQKILEMAGYRLITAKNGEEAVEQFRENRERIALVVCDVVMPKKNGKEVYDEVRALKPGTKFLFTSGYNDEIIHTKGILLDEIEFLVKPVNRQELLQKLRELLDA